MNIEKCIALLEAKTEVSLQELENILKTELANANNKRSGNKSAKTVLSALKRLLNKNDSRPFAFSYKLEENGNRIFTDGHRIAIVNSDLEFTSDFIQFDETKFSYPSYVQCMIRGVAYDEFENKAKKLKSAIKVAKELNKQNGKKKDATIILKITNEKGVDVFFNANYILDGLEIMQDEKLQYISEREISPMQFRNSKDEEYLVLPMRLNVNGAEMKFDIDYNTL